MNTSFAVCEDNFCEMSEVKSAKIPLGSYLEFGHVIGVNDENGDVVYDLNEEGLEAFYTSEIFGDRITDCHVFTTTTEAVCTAFNVECSDASVRTGFHGDTVMLNFSFNKYIR